ncbi:hypothetical protein [Sinorhizobium fredii]|uniref:hypothetical protein n=1 Tax=Rhizobium fredii TaxID=380 RepID=UPI003517BC52
MRKKPSKARHANTDGMANHSKGRTTASLEKLEQAKDKLRQKVQSGALDTDFAEKGKRALPTENALCVSAGLGKYFLYGDAHKGKTDKALTEFLTEMLKELEKRKLARSRSKRVIDPELRKALDDYQRLADRANIWFRRMRDMSRELRVLKSASPPQIASLNEKILPASTRKTPIKQEEKSAKVVRLHPASDENKQP